MKQRGQLTVTEIYISRVMVDLGGTSAMIWQCLTYFCGYITLGIAFFRLGVQFCCRYKNFHSPDARSEGMTSLKHYMP